MHDLSWLKRPVAHRGLHNANNGVIENTPSAIAAAIEDGFAVEVDLQRAACGTPVVFHDDDLDRLTTATGPLAGHTAKALKSIAFKDTPDHIPTLSELLELTAGRVPLVLELKSDWRATGLLEQEVVRVLDAYPGHVAVMSFDPQSVAAIGRYNPQLPRGVVAERFTDMHYWHALTPLQRFTMRHLLATVISGVDFIAYDIDALPAIAPLIARNLFGKPLLTWTVRTSEQQDRAARWADAMIFEGFVPVAR